MPIPHPDDYREKKESYLSWYLLAAMLGVSLFIFLLISTKTLIFVIKLAIEHWIWFSVGTLILLILIKKSKKRKAKKEVEKYENQYRQV